jgi:hypothetical protein
VPPPTMVRKGATFAAGVWANAAVLVDKPKDWTSFDVCGKLRGALKTKKASAPQIVFLEVFLMPLSDYQRVINRSPG